MNTTDIRNFVEKELQKSNLNLVDKKTRLHTKIFIFSTWNQEIENKIFVKKRTDETGEQLKREYNHLKTFYEELKSCKNIKCPKPLLFDENKQILVMDYIEGENFQNLITKIKPLKKENLRRYIELIAVALSRFHNKFKNPSSLINYYDAPGLQDDMTISAEKLAKCNLDYLIQPYCDFKPGNILIKDHSIYLTDLPDKRLVTSPHLDLAYFKFSLKFYKTISSI